MIDYASSNINVIGFIFTLTMGLLMLFLPRRFAVLPIIMTASFITLGQVISIASLNFTMFRIIIFFGLIRVLIRKEVFSIRLYTIDKILIAYIITSAIAYILLRNGSSEAFINQLGFIYNSFFLYIIFRALIHDPEDMKLIFKMLVLVVVPLAAAMMIEKATGRNLFAIFGGVPEYTMIRDGRLRCQGPFIHPILAGTFGATSIPFFVALWAMGSGQKIFAVLGIISATVITITTASSGPVITYAFVILGLFMWRIRDNMRTVQWIALFMIIALHIVMKAPVWALIGKLSEAVGGGGWHRVMLIDAAIEHFGEWWLLGTDYTRHWMPTGVTWSGDHTDITNYYIAIGIRGGLLSLVLFVAVLVYCFKAIGIRMKELGSTHDYLKFTFWCLGVSLFSHMTAFTSVSYFDQIIVFWYLLLAMIAAISVHGAQRIISESPVESDG